MVDNIQLNEGTGGAVLASDDVSGVHHPLTIIEYGPADSPVRVTTAAPLPVDLRADNLSGNLQIEIAASSATVTVDSELTTADLDTGAGTDTRAVVGLVLAASGGGLLVGAANPMPISDNGGAITVDGAVTVSGTVAIGTQVTPGTGATDLGKAEDGAHGTGDVGVMALAVRTASPANRSGADGDYEPLQVSAGRLWTTATLDAVPAPLSTVGGGTEATALRVTIANDSTGVVSVDDNGGTLTVDGTVAISSVGGTVTVGGTVDVASITTAIVPGIGATNLGKAEDAAHTTGDVGVMTLAVRSNAPANRSGTDGDYEPLQIAAGRLWTSATIDALPAPLSTTGGGTEATALRVTIATDSTGVLSIDDNGGTLTVDGTVAVSSITTSIVPGTGATNLGKAVDSAAGGTDTGIAVLAIRDNALSTLTPVEGDYVPQRVNTNGALWVAHDGALPITDNAGSLTVDGTVAVTQATASNLNAQVVGNIAADAVDSGNPVGMGAHARQTHPTAVADGDRVRVYADDLGRLVTYPMAPRDRVTHGRVALTSTSETSVLAAAGAGIFLDLVALYLSNESASECRVDIRMATAGTIVLSLDLSADGGGAVVQFPVPLTQATANNPITAQLSTAVSTVYVTALAIQNV